jgi:steroid delta-isomerase-like uncharacterized protein
MSAAKEIHEEMADAWNARDYTRLRRLLHPEYSYTGSDGKEVTGGPDAGIGVAKMFAEAFPDGRLRVIRVLAQGNIAMAEMVAKGSHGGDFLGVAATGRPVEVGICNVIELRDGTIYREHEYMDMLAMMTQLGVATLPGQTLGAGQ